MGRKEFTGETVVQKTVGTNISVIDDVTIDENGSTHTFRANLVNYIYNKGDIPILLTFYKDGSSLGTKEIANGYGIDNIYLQIDEIHMKTTRNGSTTVDGMGVF